MPPVTTRQRLSRPVAAVAGLLLAIYGTLAGLLWGLQAKLIFQPTSGPYERTPDDLGLPWRALRLQASDGVRLAAWYIEAPMPDAPAVLFLHGNAGDMSHRLERLHALHRLGAAVLTLDYRGYGTSAGRPSERGLERDVRAAWEWLTGTAGHAPDRIIVQGRSLGSALAAGLAADRDPGALVLESAFTSLPALAADLYPWLPARRLTRFRFDTAGALARTRCPVVIAHSPADEIVPPQHGRALADIRPGATTFVRLDGGHNAPTLRPGSGFRDAMERLVARVRDSAGGP